MWGTLVLVSLKVCDSQQQKTMQWSSVIVGLNVPNMEGANVGESWLRAVKHLAGQLTQTGAEPTLGIRTSQTSHNNETQIWNETVCWETRKVMGN